ncbi:MAG: hypothetical protein JST00_31540 [Deltaproteobacteria bacterium]|nr:hypothetical protein [Deltaproteobacteria bacterium]
MLTPLSAILQRLLPGAGPPETVGALTRALGIELGAEDVKQGGQGTMLVRRVATPSSDVTFLSASYAWDMFHERAVSTREDLLARQLVEWMVGFGHPASALEGELAARLGPSRSASSSRVFGTWILTGTSDRTSTLSFHTKLPGWAVAQPDGVARDRALLSLAATLAASADRTVLERAAAALPSDCGLVLQARTSSPTHIPGLSIELVPAMPATALARIFGWTRPVGRTFHVNQVTWELWLATGDTKLAVERPSFGPWHVVPVFDGRPSGKPLVEWSYVEPAPGMPPPLPDPLTGVYDIEDADLVRWLRIG